MSDKKYKEWLELMKDTPKEEILKYHYKLLFKVDKQKEVLDKIKDELKEDNEYLEDAKELYSQLDDELVKALAIQLINNNLVQNDEILAVLEEIE